MTPEERAAAIIQAWTAVVIAAQGTEGRNSRVTNVTVGGSMVEAVTGQIARAIREAVEEERRACAEIAAGYEGVDGPGVAWAIAQDIRARTGEQT